MDFRITGIDPAPFQALFALDDEELAHRHIVRTVADERPGFPCRISLDDAAPGARVLLLNYEHLPVDSPYRSSHAIYVREREQPSFDEVNAIPPALLPRLLAVRGIDAQGMIVAADVVEGRALVPLIEQYFANGEVAYLHAHFARRGCFAARIDRA